VALHPQAIAQEIAKLDALAAAAVLPACSGARQPWSAFALMPSAWALPSICARGHGGVFD